MKRTLLELRRGAAISLLLVLVGCPTGYAREAPAGVYPAGALSGPPTIYVGWKIPF